MSADLIYLLMTGLAVVVWAVWIIAPSSSLAGRLAKEPWVWIAAGGIYGVLLLLAFVDGLPEGAGFGSLDAVMLVFDSPSGTLAGWAHYLAFDLFVGGWILRDSPDGGRRLTPVLILTMLAGPLGLFVYLLGRDWFRGEPKGEL